MKIEDAAVANNNNIQESKPDHGGVSRRRFVRKKGNGNFLDGEVTEGHI